MRAVVLYEVFLALKQHRQFSGDNPHDVMRVITVYTRIAESLSYKLWTTRPLMIVIFLNPDLAALWKNNAHNHSKWVTGVTQKLKKAAFHCILPLKHPECKRSMTTVIKCHCSGSRCHATVGVGGGGGGDNGHLTQVEKCFNISLLMYLSVLNHISLNIHIVLTCEIVHYDSTGLHQLCYCDSIILVELQKTDQKSKWL